MSNALETCVRLLLDNKTMALFPYVFATTLVVLALCRQHELENIPMEVYSQVVEAIYHKLHSKFVFLLYEVKDKNTELSVTTKIRQLHVLLSKANVYTTAVQLQDLNAVIQTQWQGHRLPLVVIPLENPSVKKVMNITPPTMAEWLLFQPNSTVLNDIFDQQYIPLDCEFMVAKWNPQGTVQLMEVYHIHRGSPLITLSMGNWIRGQEMAWKANGFFNRRKSLNGLTLTVAVSENDLPSTLTRDNNDTIIGVTGFLGEIWKELEGHLNFRYYETHQEEWGIKMENGSWVGMIGIVSRKEADAAIGAFTMYSGRLRAVDFLIPLMEDNTNLYIREVESLELHWSSFLQPFRKSLWFAVITVLLLLSSALIFAHYMGVQFYGSSSCFQNILEAFYCIYGAFCGQGRERTPKSWTCRIVFLTAFVVGYVLVAAYSAALVSFLTVQRNELPFYSFGGLLKDGTYKLGITKGAEISYFSESNDLVMRNLYNKLIRPLDHFHDNALEGFLRLCEEDKYALVTSDMSLLRLQSGDVPCNIQKVPRTNIPGSVSIAIAKKSPYRGLFNHYLRQMWLSGILQKLRQRYWSKDIPKINQKSFGVTFTAVAPIFTILAAGIAISILLLFLECGIYILLLVLRK